MGVPAVTREHVPGTHPDLVAALDDMDAEAPGWPQAMLRLALGARSARQEGRRCECDEPLLTGDDLMCGRCLLENQGQELRVLDRILAPHPFAEPDTPARQLLGWCATCNYPSDDVRHHGQAKEGMTSWGEPYTPSVDP